MPILNKAQQEEIRQLNKARTQGKWWQVRPDTCGVHSDIGDKTVALCLTGCDATFIAGCSEAVPNLLETVDNLRELLEDAVEQGLAQHARVCIGQYHPGSAEPRLLPCNCGYADWLAKVKEVLGDE